MVPKQCLLGCQAREAEDTLIHYLNCPLFISLYNTTIGVSDEVPTRRDMLGRIGETSTTLAYARLLGLDALYFVFNIMRHSHQNPSWEAKCAMFRARVLKSLKEKPSLTSVVPSLRTPTQPLRPSVPCHMTHKYMLYTSIASMLFVLGFVLL